MPEFFKAVGAARFGVMAGVAAVLTAFFLYIAGAITEPPKTILYGGLEPRDAAAVTAKLDGMNVKYDAKEDGTILVPSDQVTKLRMALAQTICPPPGSAMKSSTSRMPSAPPPSFRTSTACARSKASWRARSRPSMGWKAPACIWWCRSGRSFPATIRRRRPRWC